MRASQNLIKNESKTKGAMKMRTPIDKPIWYAYPGMVAVVTSQYEGKKMQWLPGGIRILDLLQECMGYH